MSGDHQHGHGHAHAASAIPVLDIGGDIGAVLVYLDGTTSCGELFACPPGRPDEHFHTGVHERHVGSDHVWSALFPEVAEGEYELLDDDRQPIQTFTVVGGAVTEIDLRSVIEVRS